MSFGWFRQDTQAVLEALSRENGPSWPRPWARDPWTSWWPCTTNSASSTPSISFRGSAAGRHCRPSPIPNVSYPSFPQGIRVGSPRPDFCFRNQPFCFKWAGLRSRSRPATMIGIAIPRAGRSNPCPVIPTPSEGSVSHKFCYCSRALTGASG